MNPSTQTQSHELPPARIEDQTGLAPIRAEFFFFAPSDATTLLKTWDNASQTFTDETTVVAAVPLRLGDGKRGTLEWVKALVYEPVPEGISKSEVEAKTQEIDKIVTNNKCLAAELTDSNQKTVVFGCSGDSPDAIVVTMKDAQEAGLDCDALAKAKQNVLIPRYEVVDSDFLAPKEIWISKEPFEFKPGSAEERLRQMVTQTSDQSTLAARLAHEAGVAKPQPFQLPRRMLTSAFPVKVVKAANPALMNQYVRFIFDKSTLKAIVVGSNSELVDAEYLKLNGGLVAMPGAAMDEAAGVDVYLVRSMGNTIPLGSGVTVRLEHQPMGIANDIVLGIEF